MGIIEVNKLVKTYGSLKAVDNISFSVNEGEVFGMLGPNGAGKTTTLECVIGLRQPDSGSVEVLSLNPQVDRQQLYQKIGVQLQETSYQDKIKVFELCELFQGFYSNPYPYQELLQRFELTDKTNAYINKLSGGQKQKISIILALIANPQIVFLDELTTGLDPGARRLMWSYLQNLKGEGRTIVMTTHYMEEAEYLCDRIAIVDSGCIKALGSVDEVINMADLYTEVSFRSEHNVVDILTKGLNAAVVEQEGQQAKVLSKDKNVLSKIVQLLTESGIDYQQIAIKHPNLEDAFLKLTGKRLGE